MYPLMSTPTRRELIERYGEPDDIAQDPSNRSNAERALWALDAVNAFAKHSHNNALEQHYELRELAPAGVVTELIGDLICDLLHLGVMCGEDADDLLEAGQRHFLCEVGMGYQ